MKSRKVKVEFILETDMATNEIKKDIRNVFDKQFGIVSYIKARGTDIPYMLTSPPFAKGVPLAVPQDTNLME